jgi:hypothetical protein
MQEPSIKVNISDIKVEYNEGTEESGSIFPLHLPAFKEGKIWPDILRPP